MSKDRFNLRISYKYQYLLVIGWNGQMAIAPNKILNIQPHLVKVAAESNIKKKAGRIFFADFYKAEEQLFFDINI